MFGFPKPMATSLRIGTDITSIHRQHELLERLIRRSGPVFKNSFINNEKQTPLMNFLLKTFHRWEFPHLKWMFDRAAIEWTKHDGPSDGYHRHMESWARWQAGRWVMKEAAIKAFSPHPIFPRQIAIIPRDIFEMLCTTSLVSLQSHFAPKCVLPVKSKQGKPVVLIEPPMRMISMQPETAQKRGVRVAPKSLETIYRKEFKELSSWTLVDGSLSHDAGFAIASVLAIPEEPQDDGDAIFDDGSSEAPLHEPELGDQGFLPWALEIPSDKSHLNNNDSG